MRAARLRMQRSHDRPDRAGGDLRAGRLLLDRPAVAIRVTEERERVPGPTVAVDPVAVHDVADGRDVHAPTGELGPSRIDVRDAELQPAQRAGLHLGESLADRDRAGRAWWRQLDHA